MNNLTKNALEESLKKFLLHKPLDKITISDLTNDCGISRMAFYYHFKDIYDLVEWACIEDATLGFTGETDIRYMAGRTAPRFLKLFLKTSHLSSTSTAPSAENGWKTDPYSLIYQLIEGVVEEKSVNMKVSAEQKKFIADFYKYSFVGVMLDWAKRGMKETPREMAGLTSITMQGNIGQFFFPANMEKSPEYREHMYK